MATRSNFKRAVPAGQHNVLGSLRTTQLVEDSKAVLPAGTPAMRTLEAAADPCRAHQRNPRLSPRCGHVSVRADVEADAGDGVRRHAVDTKTEEYGLLERGGSAAAV